MAIGLLMLFRYLQRQAAHASDISLPAPAISMAPFDKRPMASSRVSVVGLDRRRRRHTPILRAIIGR